MKYYSTEIDEDRDILFGWLNHNYHEFKAENKKGRRMLTSTKDFMREIVCHGGLVLYHEFFLSQKMDSLNIKLNSEKDYII